MKGTIRIYFTSKGYGFIDGEDGISYFFHISDTDLDQKYRYQLDNVEVEFTPTQRTDPDLLRVRYRARQIHVIISE